MSTTTVEELDAAPHFTRALHALMAQADAQTTPLGVLATLGAAPFGGGVLRDGQGFADTVTQLQWEGLHEALAQSALPHAALKNLAPLPSPAADFEAPDTVPIGLLHVHYHQPTRRLMSRLLKARDADTDIDLPPGPLLEERTAFAASALLPARHWGFERLADRHEGLDVKFHLDPERMLTNAPDPDRVEVDFDDGLGLREMPLGSHHTVHYDHSGTRRVVLHAQYGADTRTAAFLFEVAADAPAPETALSADSKPIVFLVGAHIPHQGRRHICRVVVHLGKGNTTVTKPFVLAEGFPGGTHPQDLYDRINGKVGQAFNPDAKLADELRSKGFDIALIFFQDGGAQIQGNAYVYLAVLQELWKRMGQTGSIVAAGGSMGGLIARYAMAYAETNNLPTGNVQALMTFDSPHLGANVPLSIQCASRYFAEDGGSSTNKILDLPAARQMLVAQRWNASGSEAWEKPDHTAFYKELTALAAGGYPTKIKKYAISNGAGNGAQGVQPLAAGAFARFGAWDAPVTWADASAAPNGTLGTFASCYILKWGRTRADYQVGSVHLHGRDGCSGGTAAFFQDMATAFANRKAGTWVPSPLSCFVPTHSALGVAVTNAYTFKADDLKPGQSPFDAWYVSRTNDPHATINKGIKDWVLGKLV